jgi:uncharacterized protein YjaZ
MAANVIFHDDTIHEMARWAARRYRLRSVHIVFRDGIKRANGRASSGCVIVAESGFICIELNSRRSLNSLFDVLAHEYAHVIAISRHGTYGHGPTFKKILGKFIAAWNRKNEA